MATAPVTTLAPTTTERQCRIDPEQRVFTSVDPVKLSIALSQATLACADEVVVASGLPQDLAIASRLAQSLDAPLLVTSSPSDVSAELARLAPLLVTVVGGVLPDGIPAGTETESFSVAEIASRVEGLVAPPAESDDVTWLVDPSRPDLAAPVAATAAARGEGVLEVDPNRLFEEAVPPGQVLYAAGSFDPATIEWHLGTLADGQQLPGGGYLLFPGRRFVALYGNPTTSALGVLGEQGAEEAVARAQEIALGYDADGIPVQVSFEIIATVASAGPSADGNYSEEMSLDTLRPWIEVAAQNGVYVILDLQPGRTDFLTQAMIYEEFLRLPHVGLALDPEWRLEPDQVHLRQIGSVDAAEINQVSEWLAALVRDNNLPQKFFLLHQFRLDMIENRDQVQTHPELATVIQMDGQGPLGTKYDTWAALTAGTEASGIYWGWKNFYDEDTPRGGATAAEVLELAPVPVYVSFQ